MHDARAHARTHARTHYQKLNRKSITTNSTEAKLRKRYLEKTAKKFIIDFTEELSGKHCTYGIDDNVDDERIEEWEQGDTNRHEDPLQSLKSVTYTAGTHTIIRMTV